MIFYVQYIILCKWMKISKINILNQWYNISFIHSYCQLISSPTHPLGYTEEHAQSCALALHSWGQCGSVELPWSPQGRYGDLPPGTSCNNTAVWPLPLCCHGELSLHLAHWRIYRAIQLVNIGEQTYCGLFLYKLLSHTSI